MSKTLDKMLQDYEAARKVFHHRLATTGPGESVGENPAKKIYQDIQAKFPDYFPRLHEVRIDEAIELLKQEGYRIMKPETEVKWKEL